MRHRLFHAVVLAALPGCGSSDPPVTPDVTKDTGVMVQDVAVQETSAADSAAVDSATTDSGVDASAEAGPDANCYCKEGCLPCIK